MRPTPDVSICRVVSERTMTRNGNLERLEQPPSKKTSRTMQKGKRNRQNKQKTNKKQTKKNKKQTRKQTQKKARYSSATTMPRLLGHPLGEQLYVCDTSAPLVCSLSLLFLSCHTFSPSCNCCKPMYVKNTHFDFPGSCRHHRHHRGHRVHRPFAFAPAPSEPPLQQLSRCPPSPAAHRRCSCHHAL